MHKTFSFLVCSERSGSNLITRLLDGNSMICGPSPTHIFRYLFQNRPRYGDLSIDGNWRVLVSDTAALFNAKMGNWSVSITEEEMLANVNRGSLDGLIRYIYEKEAEASNKELIFVKENHAYRYYPLLDSYFEHPKFVFLARDPRDMALSWKRSDSLRGCVIRAAETWKADQAAAILLLEALGPRGRMIFIRYEDLLVDTPGTLASVCEFLGVPFEESMMKLDDTRRKEYTSVELPGWSNLQKPVMSRNFNKFKGSLSEAEIRFIEALCADEMNALGYGAEYEKPGSIESLREAILPLELNEKPEYLKVSTKVREKQMEAVRVVRSIESRPVQSLIGVRKADGTF